jgi:hypothetical protein
VGCLRSDSDIMDVDGEQALIVTPVHNCSLLSYSFSSSSRCSAAAQVETLVTRGESPITSRTWMTRSLWQRRELIDLSLDDIEDDTGPVRTCPGRLTCVQKTLCRQPWTHALCNILLSLAPCLFYLSCTPAGRLATTCEDRVRVTVVPLHFISILSRAAPVSRTKMRARYLVTHPAVG